MFSDVASERVVLAGICRFHGDIYWDICDILNEDSFSNESNKLIYRCISKIFKDDSDAKIDIPSIQSAASGLALGYIFAKKDELLHLQAIVNTYVEKSNVRKFALKIRKLQIVKMLYGEMESVQEKLTKLSGDEKLSTIIASVENDIFKFNNLLTDKRDTPEKLGEGIREILEEAAENPIDQVGISSGLLAWDSAIGGGLRGGAATLIVARIKTGKSFLGANIGRHIASNGIPVLTVDLEMPRTDTSYRVLSSMSRVKIDDLETGAFGKNPYIKNKVLEAADKLNELPYYHRHVHDLDFDEQLAYMKRWIRQVVGIQPDGKANKCVIIFDYLKITDGVSEEKNLMEYQILGRRMGALQSLASEYNIPILIFAQANREGIDGEHSGTVAGSDRLLWTCDSCSILKQKTAEEISEDGWQNGNRKLIPILNRHGKGVQPGDYINLIMEGEYGTIKEWKTKFELMHQSKEKNQGFEVENCPNEVEFRAD